MPTARFKLLSTMTLVSLVVAGLAVLPAAGAAPGTTARVSVVSNVDTVLLEDNFDAENGGAGELNYARFANWEVSDGTVDLIGNGFFDFLPGNGLYVDLDGTSSDAGRFTSKANFTLEPGDYELSFRLAGSQMGDTNTVIVTLGTAFSETFTLPGEAPFDTVTRTIGVATATTGQLSFDHAGGDNEGLKLDTVTLLKKGAAGAEADLSLAKADGPDPVLVGQALTYTLTVTNNGPSPATGVTLTDSLPDSVTFGSASPSQGSCSASGVTISCDLGSLASGASATVEIVVTPTTAGQLSNTASTQGNEADPNPANNSTTASTMVNAAACPAEIRFGQTIRCSIDAPGEVDRFTFTGDKAGDRVLVRVVKTSGRLLPFTEVVDPHGRRVRCTPATPTSAVELSCRLSMPGTHTIVIRDASTGTFTGDYSLAFQRLRDPVGCASVSYGDDPVEGVISEAAEMDCFTFRGAEGERVRVRVVKQPSGSLLPRTEVVDPDGTRVRCTPENPANAVELTCRLSVSVPGTHAIVIRDASTGHLTGDYSLAVQRLNTPVGCTDIGYGEPPVPDTAISEAAEMDCFTFDDGQAGDRVLVKVVKTSGSLLPLTEVIRPDGTTRCGPTTVAELTCRLNVPGVHTIVIRDASTGHLTGGYELTIRKL